MVYANFMKVSSKSCGIMVNRNNYGRLSYRSQGSLFESSDLNSLSISHCPDRSKKMNKTKLNKQLLSSLKKLVPDDEVHHIQELLKKGADPETTNSFGNRPIHLAIMNSTGNLELLRVIIDSGADLNAVNNHGSTPLMFSLQKRCHRTTEILLKGGVYVNFQCLQRGWTALMIASMVGDPWSVRMLLEHKANVNAHDNKKRTSLMFAVEGNYLEVIKELFAYGANPAMCDAAGHTVLCTYLKRDHPHLDVLNELLLNCASFRGLDQACFLQIMKICLREKESCDACVRTVIKIQMLLTQDLRSVDKFEKWRSFAYQCCAEIKYMESYSVSKSSSVETFFVRSLREGCMPKESELEALLPMLVNNYFPIYSDILRARLRKPFLKEKFTNMLMYATKGTDEIILLNSDINFHLKPYLSEDDMINFVFAAYITIDSRPDSYSSLYPKGATCNWNDLIVT